MGNNAVNSKNFIAAINMCIDNKLNQLKFITFAQVTKVNDNYTINAKPMGSKVVGTISEKGKYVEYPEIIGIPYLYINSPKVDEYCILLHLDTNISSAKNTKLENGIKYVKGSQKSHSLNNCVAICGFKNITDNLDKTQEDIETAEQEVSGIAKILSCVKYIAQQLTEEQQTQARDNINAQVKGDYVAYTEQTKTQEEKNQAQKNIGVTSVPIGAIIQSAIPLDQTYFHLLDGTVLTVGGIYDDFINFIKAKALVNPNISCTLTQYNDDITNTGNCGKFVITDTTVKLPTITRFVQGLSNINDIGTSVSAGLPNIEGSFTAVHSEGNISGCIEEIQKTIVSGLFDKDSSGGWGTACNLGINANFSNSIYGNSTTVQPEATKYPYYICIANGYSSDSIIAVENVINELNNKANKDASNITLNVLDWQNKLNDLVKPNLTDSLNHYQNGQATVIKSFLSSDKQTWYRIWSDGWKECGGTFPDTNTYVTTRTIYLPIEFSNTNYCVLLGQHGVKSSGGYNAGYTTKTINSFTYQGPQSATVSNNACDYYCCGYGEIWN